MMGDRSEIREVDGECRKVLGRRMPKRTWGTSFWGLIAGALYILMQHPEGHCLCCGTAGISKRMIRRYIQCHNEGSRILQEELAKQLLGFILCQGECTLASCTAFTQVSNYLSPCSCVKQWNSLGRHPHSIVIHNTIEYNTNHCTSLDILGLWPFLLWDHVAAMGHHRL